MWIFKLFCHVTYKLVDSLEKPEKYDYNFKIIILNCFIKNFTFCKAYSRLVSAIMQQCTSYDKLFF